MSKKQLEAFLAEAQLNKKLKYQIEDCGSDNRCIAAVGKKHGHKFSPATVSHWQREHTITT